VRSQERKENVSRDFEETIETWKQEKQKNLQSMKYPQFLG